MAGIPGLRVLSCSRRQRAVYAYHSTTYHLVIKKESSPILWLSPHSREFFVTSYAASAHQPCKLVVFSIKKQLSSPIIWLPLLRSMEIFLSLVMSLLHINLASQSSSPSINSCRLSSSRHRHTRWKFFITSYVTFAHQPGDLVVLFIKKQSPPIIWTPSHLMDFFPRNKSSSFLWESWVWSLLMLQLEVEYYRILSFRKLLSSLYLIQIHILTLYSLIPYLLILDILAMYSLIFLGLQAYMYIVYTL